MKLRLMTASVLLCLLVGVVLFLTQPMFLALCVVLQLLALHELLGMLQLRAEPLAWCLVLMVCALLGGIYIFIGPLWLFVFGGSVWMCLFGLVAYYARYPFVSSRFHYLGCVLGTIICAVFVLALYGLREVAGPHALLALIIFVCVIDSMAYVVGRAIGRRPLLSKLSPGKTIEGTIGGVGCGIVFAWVMALPLFFGVNDPWKWLPVVCFLAVISVLGDLVESMLKRILSVKDSGTLLPGHGGVLDRIDSLLAVLPWAVLGYWYMLGDVRWLQ